MTSRSTIHRLLMAILVLGGMLMVAGCGDDGVSPDPGGGARDVGIVVNSVDISLSVFPVDSPGVNRAPVGLAPAGSPVGVSVQNGLAAVPMGLVPAVVIVDLEANEVLHTVPLPENSGATGSAFLDDSTVLVANPGLGSVTPVNALQGTTGTSVEVGGYPQGVSIAEDRVLVVDARLGPDFQPTGPGRIVVLDRGTLGVLGEIELSGLNPGGTFVEAEDRVWVVTSGTFGAGNGSLALVDPLTLQEVEHHEGFGEFPSGVAVGPGGNVHVASFSYGVAVWDPQTTSFLRSPDDALAPQGVPSVSDVAFDSQGRLYTLEPACDGPGEVHRLSSGGGVLDSWDVGTCPVAITFGAVGG